jgi:hypothetical protein
MLTFLSLFLGLVSGWQVVDLHAGPEVRSVRVVVDGAVVETFESRPFRGPVDIGPGLKPREMVAIGFDAKGVEIARATQLLNVPRRQGEVEIVFEGSSLRLKASHRLHAPVERVMVRLDGKKIATGRDLRNVSLPKLDPAMPHVVAVDAEFTDGFVAKREAVVDAATGYSDASIAELTPISFTQDAGARKLDLKKIEGCFQQRDGAARVSGVDDKPPVVIFVKDPDSTQAAEQLQNMTAGRGRIAVDKMRRSLQLLHAAEPRVFWPLDSLHTAEGEPVVQAFDAATFTDEIANDMLWLVRRPRSSVPERDLPPRHYADAVATAAISASAEGRRRAVVLVLAGGEDASHYSPEEVQQYLRSIGVPLFVWSLASDPKVTEGWDNVDDIITLEGFVAAVKKLNDALAVQRIAWVAASPIEALKVRPSNGCAVEPLAKW